MANLLRLNADYDPAPGVLLGSALDTGSPLMSREGISGPRLLGVEIELGGLRLDEVVHVVVEALGGTASETRANAYTIKDTDIGTVRVELDAQSLQTQLRPVSKNEEPENFGEHLKREAYRLAGDVSSAIVPIEIVTEPLPVDEVGGLDDLVFDLRDAGAVGTSSSPLAGYGLHLNPSAPELSAGFLTRLLRSFALLEQTLWIDCGVDFTRRALPFISYYPQDYVSLLADETYAPAISELIDDYLAYNATRNRALDMLPLFKELDDERVSQKIDDPLVKPRPAFHYRLPNCLIDDENWSIEQEWRRWLCVEALADNQDLLSALCQSYREFDDSFFKGDWPKQVAAIIR